MTDLHARDEIVKAPTLRSYNWETSDAGQKTMAVKMTITGIVLSVIIAVIAGSITTDKGDSVTQFSKFDTTNTILD
ncbi:MAG: hypothetical protein SP4CHLAM5_07480 [Chlamydiia bacterium]|nr:hypothetical protein [Chlamydiia bacterium]MCH9618615.1 hypothetical protein [Chlamydiia bacterium]MCH9624335.1 hypothetical protein [Chlamydiia bacterium]